MIKISFTFETKTGKPDIDWQRVKRLLTSKYPNTKNFIAKFTPVLAEKTYSQLKYFHSDGFLGRIVAGFREAGYDIPYGKEAAKDWVKFQIKTHPEVDYTKKIRNMHTGEIYKVPKSFSDISKKEMSKIIDWTFRTYQRGLDIILDTAEEYKRKKGLK